MRLFTLLYEFALPVVTGVILFWCNRKLHQSGERTEASRHRFIFRLIAIGLILLGIGGLINFVIRPIPVPTTTRDQENSPSFSELEGTITDKEYRNDFFRLRLPMLPGWIDVMDREKLESGKGVLSRGACGFSIVKPGKNVGVADMAVQLAIEGPATDLNGLTGRKYLEIVCKRMGANSKLAINSRFSEPSIFAGVNFDRLDLRSASDNGEIGITMYATILNGYAVEFICWYASEELPEDIQRLLNGMSRITVPSMSK